MLFFAENLPSKVGFWMILHTFGGEICRFVEDPRIPDRSGILQLFLEPADISCVSGSKIWKFFWGYFAIHRWTSTTSTPCREIRGFFFIRFHFHFACSFSMNIQADLGNTTSLPPKRKLRSSPDLLNLNSFTSCYSSAGVRMRDSRVSSRCRRNLWIPQTHANLWWPYFWRGIIAGWSRDSLHPWSKVMRV